jgi:hypothetical protein
VAGRALPVFGIFFLIAVMSCILSYRRYKKDDQAGMAILLGIALAFSAMASVALVKLISSAG